MKILYLILTILLTTVQSSPADTTFSGVCGLKNVTIDSSGDIASAGYFPATIEVREGGGTAGTRTYKFIIYDSSGNVLTNSTSSEFVDHATMGTQSGTFTDCQELTPGDTYLVAVITSSTIVFGASTGANGTLQLANAYPNVPSSLAGSSSDSDAYFAFVIKNSSGETLLSKGNMTETTTVAYEPELKYNKVAGGVTLTCETL